MSETTTETDGDRTRGGSRSDGTGEMDDRARWRAPVEPMGESDPEDTRVLVLTGLGHKNDLHYGPLADIAEETTLVCLDPEYVGDIENANYVQVPDFGPRILRVLMLFVVALLEGYRNEYDTVASISLVPYGLYALALKHIYGYQAFLGIIGIDLDHHAEQWYGAGPRWAFRQFDAVSVPGSDHAERLLEYGLERERIHILTNAIDTDTYHPIPADIDTEYDFVWVGRFGPEKDPVLFVEALAELEERGNEFNAVMVGNGALRTEVVDAVAAHGLEDRIDFAGWVDEPLSYYRQSETFVLTSRRDALPLAMLEAMASGLPAVVPDIGSVTDAVTDGQNGVVVDSRHPRALAAAMERCLDKEYRAPLAEAAPEIRESVSMDEAEMDWRNILTTLGNENTVSSSTRD